MTPQVTDAEHERRRPVSTTHHRSRGPHEVLLRRLELRHHRREHEHVHHHAHEHGEVRDEVPGVVRGYHRAGSAGDDVRRGEPEGEERGGLVGRVHAELLRGVAETVERGGDGPAEENAHDVGAEGERDGEPPRGLEDEEVDVSGVEDDVAGALRGDRLLGLVARRVEESTRRLDARLHLGASRDVREGRGGALRLSARLHDALAGALPRLALPSPGGGAEARARGRASGRARALELVRVVRRAHAGAREESAHRARHGSGARTSERATGRPDAGRHEDARESARATSDEYNAIILRPEASNAPPPRALTGRVSRVERGRFLARVAGRTRDDAPSRRPPAPGVVRLGGQDSSVR